MHRDDICRLDLLGDSRRIGRIDRIRPADRDQQHVHIADFLERFFAQPLFSEVPQVQHCDSLHLKPIYRIEPPLFPSRPVMKRLNPADRHALYFIFPGSGNEKRLSAERFGVGMVIVRVGHERHVCSEPGRRQSDFLCKRVNRYDQISGLDFEARLAVPRDYHTNMVAGIGVLANRGPFRYTAWAMTENEMDNNQSESDNAVQTPDRAAAAAARSRHPMESLLKSGNLAFPKPGELAEGTVIEKRRGMLFVDLGIKGTGIVYGREYKAAEEIIKTLNPGDPVHAKIVELDNDEGYIELSLKEAGEEKRWVKLKNLRDSGEAIELKVLEANRGGLILELENLKGFLPASQLSIKNYPRVEGGDKERILQELQKLVGNPLRVKVIDIDPQEQKLIFSEKGVASEESRAALAKFAVGDVIEGEVTGVVDFGAFVRFGDTLEGLIHISEIDWTLIEDPRQVLKPGDLVKAKIIDIQGEKIALSLKALKEDPWVKIAETYHKGDTVKGKITRFTSFGAFAEIEPQIQGLIHISEFGTQARMQETLAIGQTRDLKILLLDPKEHRMSLGIPREVPAPESNSEAPAESSSSPELAIEAKHL